MFVLKLLLLILVLGYFTIMWKVVPDMMEDDIIGSQPTHVKVIYAIITPFVLAYMFIMESVHPGYLAARRDEILEKERQSKGDDNDGYI